MTEDAILVLVGPSMHDEDLPISELHLSRPDVGPAKNFLGLCARPPLGVSAAVTGTHVVMGFAWAQFEV